jgi:carbon monoxide dehydrogenase subunit G
VSVVQVAVDVDATPDQVWNVVSDPHNLPRWDRRISKVEGVPAGGLRSGSEYTTEMRFMGARARTHAKVVELRVAEYSRIQLHGLLDATVETWVEPLGDGRSRLRHRIDYRFRGGPIGELAARAIRRLGATTLLKRGVAAQKRQVESATR